MASRNNPHRGPDFPPDSGNLDAWIIWWAEDRYMTRFMSGLRKDHLRGYDLWLTDIRAARVFSTRAEAEAWVDAQGDLRGRRYDPATYRVGTFADFIASKSGGSVE